MYSLSVTFIVNDDQFEHETIDRLYSEYDSHVSIETIVQNVKVAENYILKYILTQFKCYPSKDLDNKLDHDIFYMMKTIEVPIEFVKIFLVSFYVENKSLRDTRWITKTNQQS